MASRHRLIVISGPSGAGKGTLIARLRGERPQIGLTVSATTRKARAGERDGIDYYFLSGEEFSRRVDAGEFVEWAEVHGNRYGTLRSEIDRLLAGQGEVVLELDVQGAENVRRLYPGATLVFIEPPSMAELERRLRSRGTESDEEVRTRLCTAEREMSHAGEYDLRIVNDDLDDAFARLEAVMDDDTDGGMLTCP